VTGEEWQSKAEGRKEKERRNGGFSSKSLSDPSNPFSRYLKAAEGAKQVLPKTKERKERTTKRGETTKLSKRYASE